MGPALILLAMGLALTGACSREVRPREQRVVVVAGDPAQQQAAATSLPSDAPPREVGIASNARARLWQLPADQIDAFEAALRARGTPAAESLAPSVLTIIADESAQAAAVPVEEQRLVNVFTAGLPPDRFRVTAQRLRGLSLDFSLLAADPQNGLWLQLLGGQRVQFSNTAVERRTQTDITWYGTRSDGEPGEAVFVVRPEGVTGTVRLQEQSFTIVPLPAGRQLLFQDNARPLGPDHPPSLPSGGRRQGGAVEAAPTASAAAGCTEKDATRVDMLAVYSQNVAAAFISAESTLGGLVQLAIDDAKSAFEIAKVNTRIRLVGVKAVSWSEAKDLTSDLRTLVKDAAVGQMRNQTAADIVILLRLEGESGAVERINAEADSAFGVVAVRAMGHPAYRLTHEIGHMFGARHHPASDSDSSPFAHGHGHANPARSWATIMAHCNGCKRIPYWASPHILYSSNQGTDPTGVAGISEDARVIDAMTPVLASFRCSKP